MFKFINQFISKVYILLFGSMPPIILEYMKTHLQLIPKTRIGDWNLFENHTIIKLYGYEY